MRRTKDIFINIATYLSSSVGLLVLIVLLVFIFQNGFKTLSYKLLISDYYETVYNTNTLNTTGYKLGGFENPNIKDTFFSPTWGVALRDGTSTEGNPIVEIAYIATSSPFSYMNDASTTNQTKLQTGYAISKIVATNQNNDYIYALEKDGANNMVNKLDKATMITDMISTTGGGGIRGSLLTTLYLIGLTLIIALPLGISAAIYLNEYAKRNELNNTIRSMIDMTSGIPSIIFGLLGAIIFIPFMNNVIGSKGGSIASGALTLSIMLLPIIIKTTEEALKVVPESYRSASLSLGASETQTTFRVVLPNALGGILAATLLSIGRIIGESAALIYAIGTAIKDKVAINEKSTSLAVHIWSIMSGENPNYELASAIAIIILIIVFILSITVKLISRRLSRKVKVTY